MRLQLSIKTMRKYFKQNIGSCCIRLETPLIKYLNVQYEAVTDGDDNNKIVPFRAKI